MGNKIEVLLSHIVTLEEFFDSRPGGVAEQRHRDELIRYVLVFSLGLTLTSFQQVRPYARTAGVTLRRHRVPTVY